MPSLRYLRVLTFPTPTAIPPLFYGLFVVVLAPIVARKIVPTGGMTNWETMLFQDSLAGAEGCITPSAMNDITVVLQSLGSGGSQASEQLLTLVYDELRRLAAARMARESPGQTIQATALVHEAWLQLTANGGRNWQNRAHFFGAAADAMRRILIDNARRKARLKHGGGQSRVDIESVQLAERTPDEDVLLIDEALERLQAEDPEKARIVVMKFFGGLTNEEVAQSLGISERTVDRQWACAKARLFRWIREQR